MESTRLALVATALLIASMAVISSPAVVLARDESGETPAEEAAVTTEQAGAHTEKEGAPSKLSHADSSSGGPTSTQVTAFSQASASLEKELRPEARIKADKLIAVFENEQLESQYGYAERLEDGRGYTLGRAGFTTGTGDALDVVKGYLDDPEGDRKLKQDLEKYLPRLEKLAETESASVRGLSGFTRAWTAAAEDPAFRKAQDAVVDELYYKPAMQMAGELGTNYPLTKAALYEAMIQHGNGEDPDSVGALAARATKTVGGTPKDGVPESKWLGAFLDERRKDLAHAYNRATRKEWAESVGRADAMRKLFDSGNYDLTGPFTVDPYGTPFTID